jgi:hypothetical protein
MPIEIQPAPIVLSYNPEPATLTVATPQGEQQVPWFSESSTEGSELDISPQGPLYDTGLIMYIKAPDGTLDQVRSFDSEDPMRESMPWGPTEGAGSGYVLFRPRDPFNSSGPTLTISLTPHGATSTEEDKKVRVKLKPIIKLPGTPVVITGPAPKEPIIDVRPQQSPGDPTGFELSVKWTITNS